jgi:hypothetical protein
VELPRLAKANARVKSGIAAAVFHLWKDCGSAWLVQLKIRLARVCKQNQRRQPGHEIEPANVKSTKLNGCG